MRVKFILLLCAVAFSFKAYSSPFEEPECLKTNINFWYDIYTKYDAEDGLVIDATSPEIKILNKVKLPLDDRARKKLTKRIKFSYEFKDMKVRIQRGVKTRFQEGLVSYVKLRSMVEAQLKKQNMPVEISALPHVESGYNVRAISKVGARGLWQVMPGTARMYGLNPKLLMDPSYNTKAGLFVIGTNYAELNSWPLSLTAYNHGLEGVKRAVKEVGSTDICKVVTDYKGTRFGVSSRNFYASFLAVLRILREKGLMNTPKEEKQ